MNVGVRVDGSLGMTGWASEQGMVDICFEDAGKVLDVVLKISYCKVCKNQHEPDCLLNHTESASVSENLLDHCKKYFGPKCFYSKQNYQ